MRTSSVVSTWAEASAVYCELPREGDLRRADREPRAVLELDPLHALAVHLDAVRRVEVDDPVRGALLSQLGVPARDVRVGRPARRRPSSARSRLAARETSCRLPSQVRTAISRWTPRSTAGRGLRRLRHRGGLVDHRRSGRRRDRGVGFGVACGLHHPRRDAEHADVEVVVGLELHARRREQRRSSRVARARRGSRRARSRSELLVAPRTARGRAARGRSCTRSARRRATPRRCGDRPSP